VRVDIWSDLVCPWCYLGKRRFEKALAGFAHRDEVEVVHRSFQLDPSMPKGEPVRQLELLSSKYGMSLAQAKVQQDRLEGLAAAEGLEYHLSDGLIGNTFDGHRLVHLANEHGLADEVVERLYRAALDLRQRLARRPGRRGRHRPGRGPAGTGRRRLRRRGHRGRARGTRARRERRPVLRHRPALRRLRRAADRTVHRGADPRLGRHAPGRHAHQPGRRGGGPLLRRRQLRAARADPPGQLLTGAAWLTGS